MNVYPKEKMKILYKNFRISLSKHMSHAIQEIIKCADNCEYRIYCDTCDELCIERFYKSYPKSRTRRNNFHKKTNEKFCNDK